MTLSIRDFRSGTRRSLPFFLLLLTVLVMPAEALSAPPKKPAAPAKPAPGKTKPTPNRATLSLSASKHSLVYGSASVLSGVVSTRQPGERVTVLAERYGGTSFQSLATVTTTSGGAWSYSTKPTIRTSYRGHWKNATSSTLTVGVSPLGAFHVLTGARFSTKILAAHSFAGRFVQFQRRSSSGHWTTLKRMRLNASSASIFHSLLPRGSSTLRIAMSVNQAGVGYLASFSRTIVLQRS